MKTTPDASLIRSIGKGDVKRAADVLASAFRGYPFFDYCFGDPDSYTRISPRMFAGFVRWAMLYGRAWTTADYNAVALRQPPGTRDMGFWNALRAGLVAPFVLMDTSARRRFGRAAPIVTETHGRIMREQPHWYCWMMGVMPTHQGTGVGKRLMQFTFEQADRAGLPCYLETFSEQSVRIHESQLYAVRQVVTIPQTQLKLYAMVRPPQ
jgi:GNAT superfamily N-acetyltransferase